jgi:hypothetical protein
MRTLWTCTILALILACTPDKAQEEEEEGASDTQMQVDSDDSAAPEPPVDVDGDGFNSDEDCNDDDSAVHPDAEEICDEIDNDCDGEIDEDGATGSTFWYEDADGDGWGNPDTEVLACEPPSGFISQGQDCNDEEETANPWALEICDGIDNNCNDVIDEGLEESWYADADGDGYGDPDSAVSDCDPGSGYTDNSDDCDDTDASVNPSRSDSCNGIDDDCDGDIDEDSKAGWALVTIDTSAGYVYEIDPSTAAMTTVSSISDTSLRINTMDVSENGTAVVQDAAGSQMLHMDACTGTTSLIGSTGVGNMCGIAFGPGGLLYGMDTTNDQLVEIDIMTGAGTVIGPLGFELGNCGLSYDCTNDRLIGANATTSEIFTVDPVTGLGSGHIVTDVPFDGVGLDYDPASGVLYASSGDDLYHVDPSTGATTFIGALDGESINDLALHPTCP